MYLYVYNCFLLDMFMILSVIHVLFNNFVVRITVFILSFRTDRPGQTVQTQIRLLLEEQSDQGLHCLQFPLYLLDALL